MSTFFLHNSEVYGFMFDPAMMALNPQNVITFTATPGNFTSSFLSWMASLPTTLPAAPGVAWNNGGVPCVSQP